MFFKKNRPQSDIQILDDSKPIYVLGNGDLAMYLAAKIQSIGKQVFILTPFAPVDEPAWMDFNLKEEYNLQKKQIKLPMISHIKTEPECLIIASDYYNLKSHLTLLPSLRFPDIWTVCFNQLQSFKFLQPLLGKNCTQAYFHGFLSLKGNTLLSCGIKPEIVFTGSTEVKEQAEIFQNLTDLTVELNENNLYNFWMKNAPFMVAYLSLAPKQHVSELLNSSEQKQKMLSAIDELVLLARSDKVKLSADYIVRQLINCPRNYFHKDTITARLEKITLLDCYYHLLLVKAREAKCKIPVISQLIKDNYALLIDKK